MTERKKSNNQTGYDVELLYLLLGMALIVGCWYFWTYARQVIIYPAFALDWVSIKLIEVVKGLGIRGQETLEFVENILHGNLDIQQTVSWEVFKEVRTRVGMQTRVVIAGLIFGCALLLLVRMEAKQLNRTFSLAGGKNQPPSFIKYQAEHWKITSFGANFNPDENGIEPSYTPMEWLLNNNIRFEENSFNRDLVKETYIKQLGNTWRGFSDATVEVQTVLVICALHLLRRPDALQVREQISCAWATGSDGIEESKSIIAPYVGDPELEFVISKVTNRHGFEHTAAIGLLAKSKEIGGILPSSEFLWLRKANRSLWYAINNFNRRKFHIEGAAVIDHYFHEESNQCAIFEPQVMAAIDGLVEYLESLGIESLTDFQRVNAKSDLNNL